MTPLRLDRALFVLLLLLAGPTGSAVADETPEDKGRKLFLQLQCNKCHTNAKDAKAPNLQGLFGLKEQLTGGEAVKVDEAYITESIRKPKAKVVKGWEPIMPVYDEEQVPKEEVEALVAYIKSLKPGAAKKEE